MVLISEVIMVVTTFVTLCQSAPARRGTKVKHDHRHRNTDEAYSNGDILSRSASADPDHYAGQEPSASGASSNWTKADSLIAGTSAAGQNRIESNLDYSLVSSGAHRQHDFGSPTRRRHQQHRSQQHNNRGRYEHLCETTMRTVHLNTETEEYNPPFYVEVRCRQPAQTHGYSSVQKCAFNLLHCVQTYSTMNFSVRKADGSDCWQPFTLDVPSGCECMWPIEEFGPLNRHDDL